MWRSRSSSFSSTAWNNAVSQLNLKTNDTIGFPEHFVENDKLTVADWDLNKRSNDGLGWTSLHMAAFRSDSRAIQLMIQRGANVHLTTKMGSTPLHLAAEHNCVEGVRLLLDAGADVHAKDMDGATPLHRAAVFDGVAVMKLLLERGADPNGVDRMGRSPLHAAANVGQTEAVRMLLSMSSDNATDKVVRACMNILSAKPPSSFTPALYHTPNASAHTHHNSVMLL